MKKQKVHPAKGLAIEILGWILVVLGLAALVLPGPGLLGLFAGLALLSTRYEWAERRVEPIRKAAIKGAEDSVSDAQHIIASVIGVLIIAGFGILWGLHPAEPGWWPLPHSFWLPGGWGTGGSLIGSSIIAAGIIVFSFIKFRK